MLTGDESLSHSEIINGSLVGLPDFFAQKFNRDLSPVANI